MQAVRAGRRGGGRAGARDSASHPHIDGVALPAARHATRAGWSVSIARHVSVFAVSRAPLGRSARSGQRLRSRTRKPASAADDPRDTPPTGRPAP